MNKKNMSKKAPNTVMHQDEAVVFRIITFLMQMIDSSILVAS